MAGEKLDGDANIYGINEHSVSELQVAVDRVRILKGAAEVALSSTLESSKLDSPETKPVA